MDIPLGWQLFIQVILIAVNAVFASAEIAIVSMNELKLEKLAEEGKNASFIALYYGEDVSEADGKAGGLSRHHSDRHYPVRLFGQRLCGGQLLRCDCALVGG